MLMSYAKLGCKIDLGFARVGGLGLGNHLFPWARFTVATRRYRLQPLAPTWFQLKRKQLLNLDRDPRLYAGLFHDLPEYITGPQRLSALYVFPRFPEGDLYTGRIARKKRGIVVFEGMEDRFGPFLADHKLLRTELLRMTRQKHLLGLREDYKGSITMHIRLGDFLTPQNENELRAGRRSRRIPVEWYIAIAKKLRRHLGDDAPIHVFSDGTPAELLPLAELPASQIRYFGSSIADLWAISAAHVLIASGSTFSQWGAFLGRMPTIYYPGQMHCPLFFDQPDREVEQDADEELPKQFIKLITGG